MRNSFLIFSLLVSSFACAQDEISLPARQGAFTIIDDIVYEVAPDSPGVCDGVYFKGAPALWASSVSSANECASNFKSWLDDVNSGVIEVPFWESYEFPVNIDVTPTVFKCFITDSSGNIILTYYRIMFFNSDTSIQWGILLDHYSNYGSGTGGYNDCYFYSQASPYSDSVTAQSTLAGATLATDSASDSGESVTLSNGITFTQTTAAAVDADEGDYSGTSTVNSTASASSDGTTVNITNNTEVNTNLELGDAPEDDSYEGEDPEEKEVKSSEELLDDTEPRYTYINSDSTEYSIDYNKLWEDCKEKLDEIFGTEKVTYFFEKGVQSGGYLQPWNISFIDPWINNSWGFTVDFTAIQSSSILTTLRSICSFGIQLGTLFLCIKLFS